MSSAPGRIWTHNFLLMRSMLYRCAIFISLALIYFALKKLLYKTNLCVDKRACRRSKQSGASGGSWRPRCRWSAGKGTRVRAERRSRSWLWFSLGGDPEVLYQLSILNTNNSGKEKVMNYHSKDSSFRLVSYFLAKVKWWWKQPIATIFMSSSHVA